MSQNSQAGIHNVVSANLTKIKIAAFKNGSLTTGWVAGSTFRLYGYVG